jgi:hypothetical protein
MEMIMARFRGTIMGNRGGASRLGTDGSGLRVTANGWDAGVVIEAGVQDGMDVFHVYKTGGSNGGSETVKLATIIDGEIKC